MRVKTTKTKRSELLKVLLSISLILTLLFSSTAITLALASNDALSDVHYLLENYYVDPVSDDVLNAPNVDETLQRLGDPNTLYFNAADYQNFLNTMENRSFSGIGVRIDIVPEGVAIISVIQGSPAEEAGLQAGDIIIEADGQTLVGLSSEKAVSILRGPDESKVDLKVKRGNSILPFSVIRQVIEDPTVTGEKLDGDIGYIAIHTFGSTTPGAFANVIQKLRMENVNSWIIDLRDNPGGYLSAALNLAGYFIGPDIAVQIKDRNNPVVTIQATDHGFVLNQPVIFLTNEYSASASEILAAVVKDYQKAVLIGSNTYGKGTVQSMYNLSDGGVLKMTIARFYSPKGNVINKVGILPDVPVQKAEAKAVAELLLSGIGRTSNPDKSGYAQFTTNTDQFEVSLSQACRPEFWQSWGELIAGASDSALLQLGGSNGWTNVNTDMLIKRWPLYYPNYRQVGDLNDIPLDKKFTVHFWGKIDWQTVNEKNVELINSSTGKRVPLAFQPLDDSNIRVMPRLEASLSPKAELNPGTTYWLVINQSIKDINGRSLSEGALAVVRTAGSPVTVQSLEARLKPQPEKVNHYSDYGQAIID
jgi:carboxyl-terminal processing protease